MKRVALAAAGLLLFLMASPPAQADSYIPPSYFRTMSHINTNHAHQKALHQVQVQMQQLAKQQTQRALQGLQPTAAMVEQARRLALLAAYHEQMIESTNGMIHQGRLESRRHYWEMMLRRALYP